MSATLAPPAPSMAPPGPAAGHPALAVQVEQLGAALTGLAAQQHAVRLLRMIHRPGWTTRPEAALVTAMTGHLAEQLAGLHRAHDALLGAADLIGA